ncbi:hypothetical protein AAFO90_18780 [Phaeobacter sp. CAU 1743]|uniref:hypothetical protein n=1 Tax=Phaeobacter sp. CAU 1743 TaxID=3140367 RepID=UPI00325BFF15
MTTYAVLSIMGGVLTGRCFRGVAACHAAVAFGRNLRVSVISTCHDLDVDGAAFALRRTGRERQLPGGR